MLSLLAVIVSSLLGSSGLPAPEAAREQVFTIQAVADEAPVDRALVKVEIKLENGQVIKNNGDLLIWDEQGTVVIDAAGTAHKVSIKPERKDEKGNRLKVEIAYSRGGTPVIAPYSYDTQAKKREIIRTDGGLALAITVTPKKVKPKAKGREDGIEGPVDPNDPLDGLK